MDWKTLQKVKAAHELLGLAVQFRHYTSQEWQEAIEPNWAENLEYRVHPKHNVILATVQAAWSRGEPVQVFLPNNLGGWEWVDLKGFSRPIGGPQWNLDPWRYRVAPQYQMSDGRTMRFADDDTPRPQGWDRVDTSTEDDCGHIISDVLNGTHKFPRPHAAVIKEWADGAEVQFRASVDQPWEDVETPQWDPMGQYRIKPAEEVHTLHLCRNVGGRIFLADEDADHHAGTVVLGALYIVIEGDELLRARKLGA